MSVTLATPAAPIAPEIRLIQSRGGLVTGRAGLDPELIGETLAAWRVGLARKLGRKRISRREVADIAGLSERSVFDMEHGEALTIDNLDRILPVYGRTLADLWHEIQAARNVQPEGIPSKLDQLEHELSLVRRLAEKARREGAVMGRKRTSGRKPHGNTN